MTANNEVLNHYTGGIMDGVTWTPHDTNPVVDGSGDAQNWRGFIPDADGTVYVQTENGSGNLKLYVRQGMPVLCHVRLIRSTGLVGVTECFVFV